MDEWFETRLPATSFAASEARGFLRAALDTWALDGFGEVTELLTTELVTNAVIHVGQEPIVLRVGADTERIRVEVHDPGSGAPIIRHVDDTTLGGRGVLMVDSLATKWGTHRDDPRGKSVWFEIDVNSGTDEMHPT